MKADAVPKTTPMFVVVVVVVVIVVILFIPRSSIDPLGSPTCISPSEEYLLRGNRPNEEFTE